MSKMNETDVYKDIRFSQDKRFKAFSCEEFKDRAIMLESLVRSSREGIEPSLFSVDDLESYMILNSRYSPEKRIMMDFVKRNHYSYPEINEDVWKKSLQMQLTLKAENLKEPFMVVLRYDHKENNRLFFYGQCLDEETYKVIDENFNKKSFNIKIGDGFSKN